MNIYFAVWANTLFSHKDARLCGTFRRSDYTPLTQFPTNILCSTSFCTAHLQHPSLQLKYNTTSVGTARVVCTDLSCYIQCDVLQKEKKTAIKKKKCLYASLLHDHTWYYTCCLHTSMACDTYPSGRLINQPTNSL